MKEFIDAKNVKLKKEKVNYETVDDFITQFNGIISMGAESGDGSFHLNNGIDKIPTLNDSEFEFAEKQANEKGWRLTRFDDNYQSITYKMVKIV